MLEENFKLFYLLDFNCYTTLIVDREKNTDVEKESFQVIRKIKTFPLTKRDKHFFSSLVSLMLFRAK